MTQLGNVALQCRLREGGWWNGPSPVTVGLEHRPSRWFMQQIWNVWNVLIVKVLIVTWRMWRIPGSARMLTDTTQRMHIRKKKKKETREPRAQRQGDFVLLNGCGKLYKESDISPKMDYWHSIVLISSFPIFILPLLSQIFMKPYNAWNTVIGRRFASHQTWISSNSWETMSLIVSLYEIKTYNRSEKQTERGKKVIKNERVEK